MTNPKPPALVGIAGWFELPQHWWAPLPRLVDSAHSFCFSWSDSHAPDKIARMLHGKRTRIVASFGFSFGLALDYWSRETKLCIRQNRHQLSSIPRTFAQRRLVTLIRQRQLQNEPVFNLVSWLIILPLFVYGLFVDDAGTNFGVWLSVLMPCAAVSIGNAFYRFRCRQWAVRMVLSEARRDDLMTNPLTEDVYDAEGWSDGSENMVKHKLRLSRFVLFILVVDLFFFGLFVRWERVEISDGRGDWTVVRSGLLMPWDKSVADYSVPEVRKTGWSVYGLYWWDERTITTREGSRPSTTGIDQ